MKPAAVSGPVEPLHKQYVFASGLYYPGRGDVQANAAGAQPGFADHSRGRIREQI